MTPECVSCKRLGQCTTTSPARVLEHFVCNDYQEVVNPGETKARMDIITKFGEGGLRALISPPEED